MTTLTFGKHKGTDIKNIPTEYLEWGSSKLDSPKWKKEFQTELDRRNSEEKQKETFIKANINSPEIREMLIKEAEQELIDEENYSLENDCQYDGRIITQAEIEKLADEKLSKYQTEVQLEKLDTEFIQKWGVNQSQINKLQDAFWNDELVRNCSTPERLKAAKELCVRRDALLDKIDTV
jgi:ABC-type oligopeptide transport system substrate-binding subunit